MEDEVVVLRQTGSFPTLGIDDDCVDFPRE